MKLKRSEHIMMDSLSKNYPNVVEELKTIFFVTTVLR